jgi:hypothetical protein
VYSTPSYFFKPRQIVVLYEGTSARRYQIVYAKNLTLNRGVDNQIQFQFLDQEQKKIDITGKTLSFRLLNYNGTEVLLRKALDPLLPLTGLANLNLSSTDLIDIDPQLCSYSLEITDGNLNLPVFTNSEAGARGTISVVDSVLPRHLPSTPVDIPTHGNVANTGTTFYSGVINTGDSGIITIQPYLDQYSGNIVIQGSTLVDAGWYDIQTIGTFVQDSNTAGYTIEGFHPYLRLQFNGTNGDITNILVR